MSRAMPGRTKQANPKAPPAAEPKSVALTKPDIEKPIPKVPDAAVSAACLMVDYSKAMWTGVAAVSLSDTGDALYRTLEQVRGGKLGEVEDMLMAQASALNCIFNDLSFRAAHSEHLDKFERYLRLGLKAQGQCRATLETLAAIKNPPLVVTRQANISSGPQQVNNGVPPSPDAPREPHARAGKSEPVQNELLEARHVEWLDPRAASSAESGDKELATVGGIDGSTNSRR